MELALAVVGAAVLVFWPLVVCGALLLRLAGRYRRRGGASRRGALQLVSPGATYTTSGIQTSAVYISSRRPPGTASAGVAIQPTPPRPSSPIALSSYGHVAGAGRSPGQRHGNVA